MNMQLIFDTVKTHLLTQMEKSVKPGSITNLYGEVCLYRGPSGRKCAIGCLIPDHLYTTKMESLAVGSLLISYPFLHRHMMNKSEAIRCLDLLTALQRVHDIFRVEQWKLKLFGVAMRFDLIWKDIELTVASDTSSTLIGYDDKPYTVGDRVELHPGTDLWMQGARYGTVIGTRSTSADRVRVQLDKFPDAQPFAGSQDLFRKIP